MYTEAFGPNGILNPGCDPYPEPLLFSSGGLAEMLRDSGYVVISAWRGSTCVGAEMIEYNGPYTAELVNFAVRPALRGHGIGTAIFKEIAHYLDQNPCPVMRTELVTHTPVSQRIHRSRFSIAVGFAAGKYRKVFSPDVRESTVIIHEIYPDANAPLPDRDLYLTPQDTRIVTAILRKVPYRSRYHINTSTADGEDSYLAITTTEYTDYGYCTLLLEPEPGNLSHANGVQKIRVSEIAACIEHARKRFDYVEVKCSVDSPQSMRITHAVRNSGMFFQSFVPSGFYDESRRMFRDYVSYQTNPITRRTLDQRVIEPYNTALQATIEAS
jgi:GNAT superfamily N-acetyltransferase